MPKKPAKKKRHIDPNLAAHDVLARLIGEEPKRPPAKPKGAKFAQRGFEVWESHTRWKVHVDHVSGNIVDCPLRSMHALEGMAYQAARVNNHLRDNRVCGASIPYPPALVKNQSGAHGRERSTDLHLAYQRAKMRGG